MERNIKIEGITLKKIAIGESNVGVTILTERDEIIFTMAFGATKPKSKLFEGVVPFVVSQWDLYHDPVKDHWRCKEVDVKSFNKNIQTSLEGYYTGSLFLEIVLKSQGSEGSYKILKEALSMLDRGHKTTNVLIQFLLRLLIDQGVLPSFSCCTKCDKKIGKDLLYVSGNEEFLCSSCYPQKIGFKINPGISIYCEKTPYMSFENSLKVGLEADSLRELKSILIEFIKKHTEGKLLTLNTANGLI
ncbi:MAG: DNA repair protein RecO [Spirochaetales bacterium]|nr:DNA repair protein RecO [Spirochaetales bacterium]